MCKVCFRLTAVDEVRENAVNTLGRLLRAVIDDQTHVLQTFLARKAGVDQVADMQECSGEASLDVVKAGSCSGIVVPLVCM